jgi:adenylate cyclase
MKKSKKIRIQLLIILSFFTMAAVTIALVSLHYFKKVHEVYEVSSAERRVFDRYIRTIDAGQKFIYLETSKTAFFKTGRSPYLEAFSRHLAETRTSISHLQTRSAYKNFDIDLKVAVLSNELSKYETLFSFTLEKIKNKGFKDYGAEGTMRTYVHELESHSHQIGLANVLMLRRHEKDFLLRNDESYITKLKEKVASIKERIWRNQRLKNTEKDTLITLLQNYQYSFLELVKFTQEIGHKNEQGMSELLAQCNFTIDRQFELIHQTMLRKEASLVEYIENILMIVLFNIVFVAVFTIYIYSRKIPVVSSLITGKEEVMAKDKNYALAESL